MSIFRISTFFENLGWKVYRVPETANMLLSGGINFAEMNDEAAEKFQVKTENDSTRYYVAKVIV